MFDANNRTVQHHGCVWLNEYHEHVPVQAARVLSQCYELYNIMDIGKDVLPIKDLNLFHS